MFDVDGARKAGYSDSEIAAHLASEAKFDVASAKSAGYSDGEIVSHLATQTPGTGGTAPRNAADGPSIVERVGRGVNDQFQGAAQLLLNNPLARRAQRGMQYVASGGGDYPNPISDTLGDLTGSINSAITQGEQDYQARRKGAGESGFDAFRLGGNLLNPLNYVMPGGVAKTAVGAMGRGAAVGATSGATQPVANVQQPTDFWGEKARQTAFGGVAGGVAAPVMSGVSQVLAPHTREPVRTLMQEGVTPTPGQILGGFAQRTEEKLTSVPILGDSIKSAQRNAVDELNRAIYKKALDPIGAKPSGELGRKGVEDVADKLGAAYDNLLPKVNFRADQQFGADIQKLHAMAQNLPEAQARQFETVLRNQVIGKLTAGGTMDGITLKGVESELGRLSKGYQSDASFDNRELGAALAEIQRSIRENLIRSNPAQAKELAAINSGYAIYARIRDAAAKTGAHDGIFTPNQLQAAVRSGDKSVGKGNVAKGNALLQGISDAGVNVLGSKYPDSGTAGRVLLGGGAALSSGAIHPAIPAALIAGSLPYLSLGRNLMANALTQRPEMIRSAGNRLLLAAPYGAPAFATTAYQAGK